ncbi:MAG: hypothetical protein ACP5MD_04130 [Verrucomicrobiia bacterium]
MKAEIHNAALQGKAGRIRAGFDSMFFLRVVGAWYRQLLKFADTWSIKAGCNAGLAMMDGGVIPPHLWSARIGRP